MAEKYLTVEQIAEKLQVTERTIKRWIKEKRFPKGKELTRECIRWPESFIDNFMNEINIYD